MLIRAVNTQELYSILKDRLRTEPFMLYIHILTEPFLSLLCKLPGYIKRTSRVFLDEEKRKINDYAVKRLKACGYWSVWYVRRLHAKMLLGKSFVIVGSANLSSRSFTQYEIVIIIETPPERIPGLMSLIKEIEERKVKPII